MFNSTPCECVLGKVVPLSMFFSLLLCNKIMLFPWQLCLCAFLFRQELLSGPQRDRSINFASQFDADIFAVCHTKFLVCWGWACCLPRRPPHVYMGGDFLIDWLSLLFHLSGRGLCGGGYVALAHPPCWVYWFLVVLSVLVFL